jgi:hypothetical protein
MPYTPKQRTRKQRQRRRAGQVKRVEVVLNSESERDRAIFDYLAGLPARQVAEFIRQAVAEKIARSTTPEPETPDPAQQLNAILADLAELKKAVTIPPGGPVLRPAVASAEPGIVASSGLDLSAPRRRAAAPAAARPAPAPITELTEAQRRELEKTLVASCKGYGKGQQPAPPSGKSGHDLDMTKG